MSASYRVLFFSPSEFLFHGHSCIIKIVVCKCLSPIIWDYLLIIWTAIKQKLPARKSACLGARRKISELGEGNDRHSPWQVTVFQPSLGIMKTAGHTSPCTVDKQVPWTYPCVPRSEVGKILASGTAEGICPKTNVISPGPHSYLGSEK